MDWENIAKEGMHMNPDPRGPGGTLERIRRTRGADACRDRFGRAAKAGRQTALRLLNGGDLRFATLFLLKPQIEEAGLADGLGARNRAALEICGKILEDPKSQPGAGISYRDPAVRSAFLWMFRSGAADDSLSNEFDEILDLCACVLLRRYRETSILPDLAALIFRRNLKKGYLHDLIWALFKSRDANVLRLIAPYLRSGNERDAELARLLLHLPDSEGDTRGREAQYRGYLSWLRENSPYLTFTGESLQCSNQPQLCSVDLGAKYLCRPPRGNAAGPLTPREHECLSCFSGAKEADRTVLSDYSNRLHARSPARWRHFMESPVDEQVRIAKSGTGRRTP